MRSRRRCGLVEIFEAREERRNGFLTTRQALAVMELMGGRDESLGTVWHTIDEPSGPSLAGGPMFETSVGFVKTQIGQWVVRCCGDVSSVNAHSPWLSLSHARGPDRSA